MKPDLLNALDTGFFHGPKMCQSVALLGHVEVQAMRHHGHWFRADGEYAALAGDWDWSVLMWEGH